MTFLPAIAIILVSFKQRYCMKNIFMLFLVLLATSLVVGCNPFGNDDDDTYTGPVTVNAPANAAAFNGVKLNINPTITFASDGTTNTFTYVNNSGDSSAFPDAAGATLSGTFTYTPDATVKNKGVIAFIFADTSKNFSLNLMNFSGFSTGITSLEATKVGDSSGAVYKVQVAEGTLAPVPAATSTSTGTSTGTSTDTGTGTSTGGTDTTIPTSMQGKVMDLPLLTKRLRFRPVFLTIIQM